MQIAKVDEVAFSWHRDTVQAGDEQVALVEDGMRKKRRPLVTGCWRWMTLSVPETNSRVTPFFCFAKFHSATTHSIPYIHPPSTPLVLL
jgi:hypothetical protein